MARTRSKRGEGSAARRKRTKRRSKKKIAAASAATTTAQSPLATLENFATLPHELRVHIINLACTPPTTLARTAAAGNPAGSSADQVRPGRPRPDLDTRTVLSLMASCKIFYALLAPKLYNHVWISRPSALASLQLALSSHPDLGNHIKSLYVGPADPLPKHYNPVVMEDDFCWEDEGEVPMLFFTSSLRDDEAKLLPRWCIPDYPWLLDYQGESRPSEAINLALEVAQRTIDVDLGFGTYSKGGAKISEVEHIKRVFEVQAALDHYLMMMRRHEDALGLYEVEDEEDEELPEYPSLVITGYSKFPLPAEQSHGEEESCTVDRSQLLRHLARPYSTTDRFDHPLVFARSGLETKVLTTWTEEPSRQSRYSGRGADDWSRIFLSPASSVDYSLPKPSAVHSLLDLLRSVLIHTHRLESLALTGFLDLAVCSDHPAALFLNHLDSVSIGPFPQRWFQPLDLHRFAGVKELRLAGIRLHHAELDAIIAMFPALRKFQWSMASRFGLDHSPNLREAIYRLMGLAEPQSGRDEKSSTSATGASDPAGCGQKEEIADARRSRSSSSSHGDPSVPLVAVKMHPWNLQLLLDRTQDSAVRRAWTLGELLPGQKRRVLLAESLPKGIEQGIRVLTSEDLFQEGLDWWEEHGGGQGKMGPG